MNTNGYNTRGRNNSNTAIFINNNDDIIEEEVDENINHLDDEVDDEEEDTIIQSLSSNNNAAASLLADEILANRVVNKTREQYERTLKFLAATCSNICMSRGNMYRKRGGYLKATDGEAQAKQISKFCCCCFLNR